MIGDAVAKGECVSSRVLVWCLLAPSRGGVLLLGETWSAVLTLGGSLGWERGRGRGLVGEQSVCV